MSSTQGAVFRRQPRLVRGRLFGAALFLCGRPYESPRTEIVRPLREGLNCTVPACVAKIV